MTQLQHNFYEWLPNGKLKLRFDHHLINSFNTCERYFRFKHIPDAEGHVWSMKQASLSPSLLIGQWWSRTMELFYREMSYGSQPTPSTMEQLAASAWQELGVEHYLRLSDQDYYDKFKGASGALLMALEYYESYAEVDFKSYRILGSETGFGMSDEVCIGESDKVVVYYTGKPDLIVFEYASGRVLPLDHKTKDSIAGNIAQQFKPHPQTAGYIFACNVLAQQLKLSPQPTDRCIIRVAARLRPTDKPRDGVKKSRFVSVYPNYSLDELAEFQEDIIHKAERLRYAIEHEQFPPRESACHLFYHGCMFRKVCSLPRGSREMALRADFVKIEPWSPYEVEVETA